LGRRGGLVSDGNGEQKRIMEGKYDQSTLYASLTRHNKTHFVQLTYIYKNEKKKKGKKGFAC
jgi:hypothetical protein